MVGGWDFHTATDAPGSLATCALIRIVLGQREFWEWDPWAVTELHCPADLDLGRAFLSV